MPFYSKSLNRLLSFSGDDLDCEIDLNALSKAVAESFANESEVARVFMANVSGCMKLGTLGVHLLQIIKHDSAVRDIQTTGHLAKFLSRLDIFAKTKDYRIIGMPNRLFDEISQLERTKYFERGASLEMDGDLLDSPEAQAMMDREAELWRTLSSER